MLRSEDNSTAMAQARLVELAQARDSAAFTTLYVLHTTGICGYLLGLVGNEEDAHDLAQQAFLQAWQKLSGLHDVARFTPWLYAIARNLAYDHSRQKKGASWSSWEHLEESQADVSEPGPEDQVAQAELVRLALTTLPPKLRDCLLLQVEGKLSRREIAEVTGLGEKSVSVYLSGARKAFLQAYQRLEHEQDVPGRRNTDQ